MHSHAVPTDLTRNQGLVLGALTETGAPLSAYDILDKLRGDGLRAPLQIYRALEKLVERGLAHRIETLNAFVACADEHCHRKGMIAFAICEKCGQVDEFSDAVVEKRLRGWASDHSFKLGKTTIEMRGTCGNCAAA